MESNESSAIETSYPHVAKGLCEYWRKPECLDYLESLVFDKRGGRQGFPPDVSAELLLLYNLIERKRGPYDIWFESESAT